MTVGRRHGSDGRDQGKRERVNHREGERAELRLKLVVPAGALLSATAFSFGYMGTACYQKGVLLLPLSDFCLGLCVTDINSRPE